MSVSNATKIIQLYLAPSGLINHSTSTLILPPQLRPFQTGPHPQKAGCGSTSNLPTPIRPDRLEAWLDGYDDVKKCELISGFKEGFDIGYKGTPNSDIHVKNLKSALDNPEAVTSYIEDECKAGRVAGPFSSPPFPVFQINPIGLVPKKTPNKFRMIVDLSSPHDASSVNACIDDEFASVSYASVQDAARLLVAAGPQAFMAKTDIEKAFRLIPLRPDQYHLFCFQWQGKYYHERVLAMGARSSCKIFQKFSIALEFIAKKHGIRYLVHYLDDFFFISCSFQRCQEDLNLFFFICKDINIPLVPSKTLGPDQIMEFLGLEMNSLEEIIRLPADKLKKCLNWIQALLPLSKCRLRDLQSLLGLLNFACRVIVPGRAFLQRLIARTIGVMKPYFFVRLTAEAKKDLQVWLTFLSNYNGVTLYKEELFLSPETRNIFTDASTSRGCAAVFGDHWFALPWPSPLWACQKIFFLELVPIVLALETWGKELSNSAVKLNTDNQALASAINSQSTRDPLCMTWIRRLVIATLSFNFLIEAVFLPGYNNVEADLLSRLQVHHFLSLHPSADRFPTTTLQLPHSPTSETYQPTSSRQL